MKRLISASHIRGLVSLTLAAMTYGLFAIISRSVGYSLPLFYQNWTRCLVATLLLVYGFRTWPTVHRTDWPWIIFRSLAGIVSFILFFISVQILPVGLTYFIFYGGSTIGGYLLGRFMFAEKTTRLRLISLTLALTGLAFIYGVSIHTNAPFYLLLSMLSGTGFAFWNAISKKLDRYSAIQLTFWDNAIATILYIIASLIMRESWPITDTSMAQILSLTLGVFFVVTGLLVVYGFRKVDVQIGSLIMLTEILFAIIYAFFFFGELPAPSASVGGALILIAMIVPEINWSVVYSTYANRRKSNR